MKKDVYDKKSCSCSCTSRFNVSKASIAIEIEPNEESERTFLLADRSDNARKNNVCDYHKTNRNCRFSKNYGSIGNDDDDNLDQCTQQCKDLQETKCFLTNNHDRRPSSSFGTNQSNGSTASCTSNYHYEAKTHLCDARLFAIFFFLLTGFTIATYLMVIESRLSTTGFTLDLVNHDIWSKIGIPIGGLLNHSNVFNVIILHTESASCNNPKSCMKILNQFEYFSSVEMPYNFLVGNDGQTYEVRGWDNFSGYPKGVSQNSSIVIGLIGNYTNKIPNNILLKSTQSLIKESVRRKKLQKNYRIFGLRNVTSNKNDADALFQCITKWPHFENFINID